MVDQLWLWILDDSMHNMPLFPFRTDTLVLQIL
jgi:hypothetical protein